MALSVVPETPVSNRNEITAISFTGKDKNLTKLTYIEPSGTPFICVPQTTPDKSFTDALDKLAPEVLEILDSDTDLTGHSVSSAKFKYEDGELTEVTIAIELGFANTEKTSNIPLPAISFDLFTNGLTYAVGVVQLEANRHLAKLPRYEQGNLDLFAETSTPELEGSELEEAV
jgi:hypothetical protein